MMVRNPPLEHKTPQPHAGKHLVIEEPVSKGKASINSEQRPEFEKLMASIRPSTYLKNKSPNNESSSKRAAEIRVLKPVPDPQREPPSVSGLGSPHQPMQMLKQSKSGVAKF